MKKTIVFLLCFICLFVPGCMQTTQVQNDTFDIITSFYPMYVLTQNITQGAQNVTVNNMTPGIDGCLHDYSLNAKDMKLIEKSDVFIASGLMAEPFLDELTNINLIQASQNSDKQIGDNPHIWMSKDEYIAQIDCVTESLCENDPENAEIYKNNAQSYKEKIETAYQSFDEILDVSRGKSAILLDDSLYYVAMQAGIEIAAHVHDDAQGQHNAGELAEVIKTAKEKGADFILTREGFEENMCKAIRQETGIEIVYLDPVLMGDAADLDAYQKAVLYNKEAILSACK